MKAKTTNPWTRAAGLLALAGFLFLIAAAPSCDERELEVWKFKAVKEFDPAMRAPDYNDFDWGVVSVPHQWQRIPGMERYQGRAVYRTEGNFEPEKGKRFHLHFQGVFYRARVWLNGGLVGEHEGYFEPFSFDVTDQLVKGRNVLVVEVECKRETSVTRKRQILGVFGNWDVISSDRNPGGIWAPVAMESTGAAWIGNLKLTTLAVKPGVRVRVQAELKGKAGAADRLSLYLAPDNFEGDTVSVALPLTDALTLDTEIALPGVKAWQPHKRGFPHCYLVYVQLKKGSETLDESFFLTSFRTVRVEDGYHFFINDLPLYIKGNNYAPSLVYLSETDSALAEKDVAMMKAAHYDMIRVHAHVDAPDFYEACDRGGMLIWQDGPFQWGYDPSILNEATRQVRAMVRLLYNHPSIAVWTAHNEPLAVGLDRSRPNPLDLARSVPGMVSMSSTGSYADWNFKTLDAALERAIKAEDPSRPVNRASGRIGGQPLDWHNYLGWYSGKVDDLPGWMAREKNRDPRSLRFVTEFGAQALPNYESAIKFMDPKRWPLQRRRLHLENCWQPNLQALRVPLDNWRDLKTLIAATQDYQARLLKFHIERIRLAKYDPNYGVIAFLHNDSQPAITWSVVDVWRVPKKAYYTIADCYRDPYVMTPFRFAEYRAGEAVDFPVWVVNDTLETWPGCKVKAILPDGTEQEWTVDLGPDMKPLQVGQVLWKVRKGMEKLILKLSGAGFEEVTNTYELLAK